MAAPTRSIARSRSRRARSSPIARPDLTNTSPVVDDRPVPAMVGAGAHRLARPVGPSRRRRFSQPRSPRASTSARPSRSPRRGSPSPELDEAVEAGRLKVDGKIVQDTGDVAVTKAAIEPVWYLPGIAERFGVNEDALRRTLFEQTGGMYPELVTRPDLAVFLPPIGGITLYIFGDPSAICGQAPHARLPRARRVQRLGRVRLRHLHLPALSHPRHRGMRQGGAERRRRA